MGSRIWWTGYGVMCLLGAGALFVSLLRECEPNALSVSRLIMLSGLIIGMFVRFNSACQPLSGALLATGSTFAAFLIATDWCHRRGTFWQKVGQVWDLVRRRQSTMR